MSPPRVPNSAGRTAPSGSTDSAPGCSGSGCCRPRNDVISPLEISADGCETSVTCHDDGVCRLAQHARCNVLCNEWKGCWRGCWMCHGEKQTKIGGPHTHRQKNAASLCVFCFFEKSSPQHTTHKANGEIFGRQLSFSESNSEWFWYAYWETIPKLVKYLC